MDKDWLARVQLKFVKGIVCSCVEFPVYLLGCEGEARYRVERGERPKGKLAPSWMNEPFGCDIPAMIRSTRRCVRRSPRLLDAPARPPALSAPGAI